MRFTIFVLLVLALGACGQKAVNNHSTSAAGSGSCDLRESGIGLTAIYDSSGKKIEDNLVNSTSVDWTMLDATKDRVYNGVGRLSNCTGALIETNGNSSAPAYVLTNGHCVGTSLLAASGAVFDATTNKTMYLNYYKGAAAESQTAISGKLIKFGSMDDTDVGIIQLDKTLAEIKALGFCAYPIAKTKPVVGTTVKLVGVPLTGIDSDHLGLHRDYCKIGETVKLMEGDYTFSASFRHRCSMVGGNSGSPIFDVATGEIVGVNNTTANDSAATTAACALNHPCEVDSAGTKTLQVNENYGQSVDFVAGCFDSAGVFDRSLSTCGINARFPLK